MEPKNSFPVTYPPGSKYTNIVIFHSDSYLAAQFFMTQLFFIWSFKNVTVFLSSTILTDRFQSALHVTDDSCMKDVLQLTTAIAMASSVSVHYKK